jgi:pilus assembly protein CpaC
MRKHHLHIVFIAILSISLFLVTPVMAAPERMAVAVNQSLVLNFNGVSRVAVANPEIADVGVVSGYEILLIGKAPGITTVHIWTAYGRESFQVEVGTDDTHISNAIKSTLGYNNIRVSNVNKTIILEGTVNDQYQKMRAEKVAGAYGDKVVNLLEITRPTQVKIEARVIEIDREKIKNLGIKWGYSPGSAPGTFFFGQGSTNSIVSATALGNLGTISNINAQVDALLKDRVAKILSQPNMITLSGDKASIMVGGEIPIPISLDAGRIGIEWKEYGIKLDVAPEVNAEGLINSKIKAEVSSLDWNSTHKIELGLNMKIPPLKTRKAESAIALASGQTMAIGGLITSETSRDVYKLPLLGDLPVLGNLFKSTSFNKGETELIILITPTIVNPQEYAPPVTEELRNFQAENPWGGDETNAKDKGASGR